MSEVLNAYRDHLKKLKALPFEMGLPEEIERVSKHIKKLEQKAINDEKASRWDGDLGCYDAPKQETEHIDL